MFLNTTCSRVSPISAIFFDLDNTLIATRKADSLTCNKLAEFLCESHAVPKDEAIKMCSSYLKAFRQCPDNPDMKLEDWRHLLWSQSLEHKYSHLTREIYLKWIQLRYHYLALTPEIKSLLKKLRQNYLLGLITNGPSCAQWEKVQLLDLKQYFDVILVSGDLLCEKPNRKIFEKACQYLGVEPKSCIMVGDKLETDIQGGIEAQLGYTVWIPLKEPKMIKINEKDPSPDYTITAVTDLPKLLPSNINTPRFCTNSLGFMRRSPKYIKICTPPDTEECNSNGSDGS